VGQIEGASARSKTLPPLLKKERGTQGERLEHHNSDHKFTHTGACSRSILDAERVLKATGLKKGNTFLDAGSGSGYLSITASAIVGDKGKIYAVDIDAASIEKLKEELRRQNITNIEASVADMTAKTSLIAGSIDVCLMANVMHGFVENKEVPALMKETTRLLKPGATLAVVEFKKLENIPGPPLALKLSPEQLISIVTPFGFRQKETVEVGIYHYAVIFVRE
jgi:ubiquinone/menaquinone biosynthesis C-methylase UbiE